MSLIKIAPGHYRYLAVPCLSFDVFLYEGREWNRKTGNNRKIRYWSYRLGDRTNSGFATKREAIEAAMSLMQRGTTC